MKNLLDDATLDELLERLDRLGSDTRARWGKMDVAQMMAHCAGFLEVAVGDQKPRRSLIGQLVGGLLKSQAINDAPVPHNSPTLNSFRVVEPRRFAEEKDQLAGLLRRFTRGGPSGVTAHPHPFFGPLTPQEWGLGQYKHLDHHLRQFGA